MESTGSIALSRLNFPHGPDRIISGNRVYDCGRRVLDNPAGPLIATDDYEVQSRNLDAYLLVTSVVLMLKSLCRRPHLNAASDEIA
jgi:hypothetical protein